MGAVPGYPLRKPSRPLPGEVPSNPCSDELSATSDRQFQPGVSTEPFQSLEPCNPVNDRELRRLFVPMAPAVTPVETVVDFAASRGPKRQRQTANWAICNRYEKVRGPFSTVRVAAPSCSNAPSGMILQTATDRPDATAETCGTVCIDESRQPESRRSA